MLSEKIKNSFLQLQNTFLNSRADVVLKLRVYLDQFEQASQLVDRQLAGIVIQAFLTKIAETEEPESLVYQIIHDWNSSLQTWTQSDFFCHPTTIIEENAKVGGQTKIWHFSHIMGDSEIGEACNLGQNVVISPNVKLGNRVKVQNNVSLYTGVQCEDNVFIGPGAVFTNVVNPRSEIDRKSEFQKTNIGKGATIGANATIVCGHRIGKYAFIAAGAVVITDVPDYALVAGVPARHIGWMDAEGNRLFPDDKGQAVSKLGVLYQLTGDKMSKL